MGLQAARSAGELLRARFGAQDGRHYRGDHDIQLPVDAEAHDLIIGILAANFPDHGFLSEEGPRGTWPDKEFVWVIDPLDGTNNLSYGIGHCAVAMALYRGPRAVLSLVVDPLLRREFVATDRDGAAGIPGRPVPLRRSTISLVTNYSTAGRVWATRMNDVLGARCKRVVSLWAPGLDLALVSAGQLDGMVCHEGNMIDVCGGVLLVAAAGGCVIDPSGGPLTVSSDMYGSPVSFVAARDRELAEELLAHSATP